MKTVLKIAKKALPAASIYFGIFFAMMVAFSFMTGKEQEKNFQATQIKIYVEDNDSSALSEALIRYLEAENEVTTEVDKELLSELIFNGLIEYVLYVEEGFEETFLAGEQGGIERQSTKPNVAFIDQKVELFFQYVRAELALGKTMEDACTAVLANSEKRAETEVISGKTAFHMRPGYYFFSFLAYILPCVLILILGPIMEAFYRKDLKMRTDCGKMSVRKQNMQIVKGILLVAIVVWGLFMLLGSVIYGKDFTGTAYLFGLLNTFVFFLFCLAIAVLLGVLLKGGDALNGASNILGLGMSFLCGVFVPSELMPDSVNKIGEFLPASWYIKNVKLLAEGDNITNYMGEFFGNCGVMAIFAVAIFCIFLVVVKRKKVA